jgi:hypothetical protein
MNIQIDFLPPDYRERLHLQEERRHRAWLAVPILLGLLATDAVLMHRVELAATMADKARIHAEQQEQRAEQVRQLSSRIAGRQVELEHGLQPLQMPRLSATLDALLAATPSTVSLQELSCRHTPWLPNASATLKIVASSPTAEHLEQYLGGLRAELELPRMQCTRTFRGPTGLGFDLESTSPGSAPR